MIAEKLDNNLLLIEKGEYRMELAWVVERLISILPVIGNLKKENREIADKALSSISSALAETSIYMTRWRNVGKRDEETEAKLVRLWSAAAVPVRHIDRELSEICQYKSDYWVNPETWDPSKTKGVAIDLESVKQKYLAKLN